MDGWTGGWMDGPEEEEEEEERGVFLSSPVPRSASPCEMAFVYRQS